MESQNDPLAPQDQEPNKEETEFEHVLANITRRLAHIEEDQFDYVMTESLREIAEHQNFERASLMAFSSFDGSFGLTHTWAAPGAPPASLDALLERELPWFTQQIRSGYIVSFTNSSILPPAAQKERDYILAHGLKMNVTVPLLVEGVIVGAVGFSSFSQERSSTPELMARLRLVGEVLALGGRHYQYVQGLKSIGQTLDLLSLKRNVGLTGQSDEFRWIAAKLMHSEHQERLRMGQVLHEDVMQILTGISMLMKSAGSAGPPIEPDVITQSMSMLSDALSKLRRLVMQLRPVVLREKGALEGIQWLIRQFKQTDDLDVELSVTESIEPVSNEVATFLYDATRKVLECVASEAGCRKVVLEFQRKVDNLIRLTVKHESPALASASVEGGFASSGLLSIKEQAELLGGELEILHPPGDAAQVIITIRG